MADQIRINPMYSQTAPMAAQQLQEQKKQKQHEAKDHKEGEKCEGTTCKSHGDKFEMFQKDPKDKPCVILC